MYSGPRVLLVELHRLEVVAYGSNSRMEYWRNADGTVRLHRKKRAQAWNATVDGVLVMARNPNDDGPLLAAPTAEELAVRVAMKESIHCVLDYGQEWEQDVGGQPLRIRPRTS